MSDTGHTGPYIITIKRPARPGDLHAAMSEAAGIDTDSISRRAVARLEETSQMVWDACLGFDQATRDAAYSQLTDLVRARGGSVGPLPDGTVIEVEPTTYEDLRERAGMPLAAEDGGSTRVIDAFNAAQAGG